MPETPTTSTETAATSESSSSPRRGPTAAARPAPEVATTSSAPVEFERVSGLDEAEAVALADGAAGEVVLGDPLAGLRRPSGGSVTDRARRDEDLAARYPEAVAEPGAAE